MSTSLLLPPPTMAYPAVQPAYYGIHVLPPEPRYEPEEPVSPVLMTAAQRKMLKIQQRREDRERRLKAERGLEQGILEEERAREALERAQQQIGDQPAQQTPIQVHPPQQPPPHDQIASSQSHAHSEEVQPQEEPAQLKNTPSPPAIRAPSPPPPPFRIVRAELICQVHLEVLNGGSFADANINLYSRRNRAGAPYAPRILALNRRILEAASSKFGEAVFADTPVDSDGYNDDSDLEDDEADDTDVPGSLTITSLPDSFDYQEPETPKTEEDITTRLGDADLMTDDEFEVHPRASGSSTPARRSQAGRKSPDEPRILDGAFKTWQAMSLYLYTDRIKFNPLRSHTEPTSEPAATTPTPAQSPCSPKSMYRLADRLDLSELKEQARESLQSCLTESNVVEELFSDFTWRYPDVLQMEVEVFRQHATHPSVTSAMRRMFAKIANGELSRSAVVLEALYLPSAQT